MNTPKYPPVTPLQRTAWAEMAARITSNDFKMYVLLAYFDATKYNRQIQESEGIEQIEPSGRYDYVVLDDNGNATEEEGYTNYFLPDVLGNVREALDAAEGYGFKDISLNLTFQENTGEWLADCHIGGFASFVESTKRDTAIASAITRTICMNLASAEGDSDE